MTDEMTLERRGSTPNPDPTKLTTEALAREVKALKELLELRLEGEECARIASCKTLTSTIAVQSELYEKGLAAVGREMDLVERNRVEQKQDSLASLAAALSAAKEAVRENSLSFEKSINKSENATNEQLKSLGATFATAIEGVLRGLSDLKERVSTAEQVLAAHTAAGTAEAKASDKFQPWVVSIVMTLVAVGSIIIQLSH